MAIYTIKCYWCKEDMLKTEAIIYEHKTESGKIYKRKGHQKCLLEWKYEYDTFGQLRQTLLNMLNIKILDAAIIKRLRDLRNGIVKYEGRSLKKKQGYDYLTIKKGIERAEIALISNFNKGWPYLAAIIEQKTAEVYREEQQKFQNNTIEEVDNIILPDFSKRKVEKKEKKIDITILLD